MDVAITTTDKELLGYFSRLNEPQKKSLLELMKTFLTPEEMVTPLSIKQYNEEINAAIKRVENGEYTTLEELEKEMGSW